MNRPARIKTAIAALFFAMFMGGCATTDTAGSGAFYGGYYDDYWYGYGYGGVVVDNPGEIGSGPRPDHPIVMPPGSQPRPEHPIATPPRAEPKANVSATPAAATARSNSFSGGGFGGGGFGGGRGGGGGGRR